MNIRALILVLAGLLFSGCPRASDPTPTEDDGAGDVAGDVVFPDWTGIDTPPGSDTAPDAEPDVGLEPGEPGTPCDGNDDCFSGFCVQTADGQRCTMTCVDECPTGWVCVQNTAITDLIWICVPEALYLCRPCASNEDCVAPGLDTGATCEGGGAEGSFCTITCDDTCPDGYACEDGRCLPADGECACAPLFVDEGAATGCAIETEFGICTGERVCLDAGLTSCSAAVPAAETCNAQDDDCDGAIDEELDGGACEVINGWGACPGVVSCAGGVGGCDGPAPAPETCNGADDDCDGETDEDLGETTCGKGGCLHTVESCAGGAPVYCDPFEGIAVEVCDGADNDCDGLTDEDLGEIPCGTGACLHTVGNCVDGQAGECDPDLGAEVETCNGLDDDCDGPIDEDLGETTCGLGVCTHTVPNCVGGVPQVCDPLDGAGLELCNGADDDCDGDVDEELGETTCGLGACVHIVPNCLDGVLSVCDPFEGVGEEICNGLDDDCDGLADEELGTVTCGLGNCAHTELACVDGEANLCDPLKGAAEETCNGLDDDCDGATDEDLGETTCGAGTCAHTVPNCLGGVPQFCDPFAGAGLEVCNGVDDDCDDEIDEGLGALFCGLGVCAHSAPACFEGQPQVCDPYLGASDEICNGADDDCDGLVDEDQGTAVCGLGICAHTELSCVDGVPNQCDPYLGAGDEVCNGLDDDCDGGVDEALGETSCGQGICAQIIPNCVGGVPQDCDPYAGALEEVCNGADDDCDGEEDEDLGTSACGLGACAQTVPNCTDGVPTICNPYDGASQEICDNDADDDCDGFTDCEDTGDCAEAAWCEPAVDMSNWGFEEPWTPGDPVPDFEISWGIQSSIIALRSVAEKHGGAASCELVWTSPDQTKQDFAQGYLTPVTPGGEVTFGVWVRDNDPAGRARLAATFHDAAKLSLGNTFATVYTSDDPGWVQVTATFDVPPDAHFVRGFVRLYDVAASWDGNASIHIDDWAMTP